MAYKKVPNVKKNSPPALLTAGIDASTGTIPIDHLEYFHDKETGALILDGITIWDPADPDPMHREEITITGASDVTGAGNLTGGARGVNADGTNGAARAFSSGAKIAVMFTTGIINTIRDDLEDLHTNKLANSGAANGKIYIGKADGTFALVNITQGANITITNADGAITIAAVGGGDFLVNQIFS